VNALLLLLVTQVGTAPGETPRQDTPASVVAAAPGVAAVSLGQLLAAADEHNVDRRISAQQVLRAEADVDVAWTALLPGLTIQGAWVHNQYESVIPAGRFGPDAITLQPQDQLDATFRVDLPLIDVGRWMRASAARTVRDGALERESATRDQIRRAVTATWYSYGAALALEQSALRSVAVAEAQLKLQEVRERTGAATELELLRSKAEVERNRQNVADAAKLIAIARRSLTTLSGMDPGASAQLPEADLTAIPPLAELEARVEELPQIKAAQRDMAGAEKNETASKLALVPIVGAQFTERVTNATSFTGQAGAFNLGVNLTWRLDGPTILSHRGQTANVAMASLALEKVRMAAKDQINSDYQTLTAALIKVKAAEAQVQAAGRARTVAATRYEVGATTQIDLIQADRDLFGAEVQHIQAKSDLASARVAVKLSAGLPIELE